MATTDPEKRLEYEDASTPSPASHEDPDLITAAASRHLDDNYALYKSSRGLEATPEEIKAVLRKLDYRIMPILFITYMLQYLDKTSLNFASVYGLQTGTHLNPKSQQYSWLGVQPLLSTLASPNSFQTDHVQARFSTLVISLLNFPLDIVCSVCRLGNS